MLVELAASSRRLTERLTESALPSDWAHVEAWGVEPIGPPSGGEPAYSYEQRPTYYGGALVALTRLALQPGGCSRP